MPRAIPLRGVIEGFYGPPWTSAARRHVIEVLAARGMNAYVYAPKSDPKHRDRWRERYDDDELGAIVEVARRCDELDVRFGFALSPGVDIDYSDAADRGVLLAKLAQMLDAGVTWIVLALDDIPNRDGLAAAQVDLVTWLVDAVAEDHDGVRWSLVPTEYVGTRPSPYLTTLAQGLPPDVDVFWTGPTVCSPTITQADARAWRDAIGGRPLLLWDNYPVNDAVMERELHLGPYRGRDARLADVVDGVLCNPMLQPRASLVALATAAEFLADPESYDESAAWERALTDVGGRDDAALRALARACCDGPLAEPEELPAHALVERLADEPTALDRIAAVRTELEALRAVSEPWSDEALGDEVRAWTRQGRHEAEAGLAALDLLELLATGAADAGALMLQSFVLLFAWSGARDAGPQVVLGPRFVMHPAVVQLPDGSPALDVGLALREDRSVVDRLARLALAAYSDATSRAATELGASGAGGS